MEMPLAEIIDRHSILRLKLERLVSRQKELEPIIRQEFETYEMALREFKSKGVVVKREWLEKLYKINGRTWDLEADIRQGKEGELGLEEVGRRALKIRDINRERIEMKNLITKESNLGFLEIKVNHASESADGEKKS